VVEGFNDLLRRARAGVPEAYATLVRLLGPFLERQAGAMADPSRPSQSTSDLVQEVLVRVWQKIDQFAGTEDDDQSWAMFRAWAGRIVRRLGLNVRRDRNARRRRPPGRADGLEADPAADDPTASALLRDAEQTDLIRTALERLRGDAGATVVRLQFFEGLSLRQIAGRMGLTYDQVRERRQAGLRRLELELGLLR
jgi:RNA polymerase sigma factor (sigma-70 family)